MLKRLFGNSPQRSTQARKESGAGQNIVEQGKQPTDAEYESLFLELLAGVNEGWSRGRVRGFLAAKNITSAALVEWLRHFGERLLASPIPNDELAARMVSLSELGIGEVGEVAHDIGMRLLRRGGETNRPVAEDAGETEEGYALAWLSRGNEQYMAGDLAGALASYDKAIQIKPDLYKAWHIQGLALNQLGRHEEALASYDKAIQINPNFHEFWSDRGVALDRLGRHEEAIASFDKAIEIKPDYHEVWYNWGNALVNLGRYEKAIASYNKALEIKPDEKNWYNRGIALGNLGQYEDAIASYDKALEIKLDYHEAWVNRGIAARVSVSCDPLLSLLSAIAKQNPALNQRGYEGALASYEEGLKYCHQDTHPEGWGSLHQYTGNAHYFRGRGNSHARYYWHKAVKSYNEALKTLTEPDFPQLHLEVLQDLIRVQLDLGETAKAEELERRCTDLLRRLLNEPNRSEQSKKQLALKFAGFQQLTVDLAVQSGDLVQAVELAAQGKNACLSWLLYTWSDEISSPSYLEMQQLLNSTTAIVYWHISPYALHTFILKHDSPSPIVLGEPRFLQETGVLSQARRLHEFEDWVKQWNQQYADYRQGKDKQGEEESSWRLRLPQMLHNLGNILDIPAIVESIQNRATKIQNLILVSHRDLHRFPLHALFPDEFTITYLPSAQLGLSHLEFKGGQDAHPTRQGNHHRLSLLSVEHPTSLGLPMLEFAQIESEAICRIFPNHTRLRSDEATKQQLKTDLPQGYNIFHFTGHGSYNFHNPALSYLALAGEDKLTLADIRNFDLRSYQLVSLAACETAITGNHTITTEFVGLVSGFMSCGVAHVISTLWTVESAASALVMIQFYQLLQQGKPEAVALAEATQWLRNVTAGELTQWYAVEIAKLPAQEAILRRFLSRHLNNIKNTQEPSKQPYNHPYFWAAFTITGIPPCTL